MTKKPWAFLLAMLSLVIIFLIFQNCSEKKHKVDDYDVQNQFSALRWRYTSGPISPSYQYNITYEVDFTGKILNIQATKGALVTGQPNSETVVLSASNLSQIRILLVRILYHACLPGTPLVGGGTDYVEIFSTPAAVADFSIYSSTCTGNTTPGANQATSGYQSLTNYLKSL